MASAAGGGRFVFEATHGGSQAKLSETMPSLVQSATYASEAHYYCCILKCCGDHRRLLFQAVCQGRGLYDIHHLARACVFCVYYVWGTFSLWCALRSPPPPPPTDLPTLQLFRLFPVNCRWCMSWHGSTFVYAAVLGCCPSALCPVAFGTKEGVIQRRDRAVNAPSLVAAAVVKCCCCC